MRVALVAVEENDKASGLMRRAADEPVDFKITLFFP
jgi:hypothetical protein